MASNYVIFEIAEKETLEHDSTVSQNNWFLWPRDLLITDTCWMQRKRHYDWTALNLPLYNWPHDCLSPETKIYEGRALKNIRRPCLLICKVL